MLMSLALLISSMHQLCIDSDKSSIYPSRTVHIFSHVFIPGCTTTTTDPDAHVPRDGVDAPGAAAGRVHIRVLLGRGAVHRRPIRGVTGRETASGNLSG